MTTPQVDNTIKGRTALVTGASGGIGSAIALKLASEGVHLALHYHSNLDTIKQVAQKVATIDASLKVTLHKGDTGLTEDCVRICKEAIVQHGKVDILVSNAGYGKRIVDIWDIAVEEFDHTLNVNLKASFLLVKGVVDGMRQRKWGRIIFISSIAAYGGGINGCHYAASKGGLMAMMKNLSNHLAKFNVSVNDVAPAMVEGTGMIPGSAAVPGVVETIPLGRMCQTDEVANAVAMFATTGFATGQSLIIAGGLK